MLRRRIRPDGLFGFLDGLVNLLEAGQRVGPQDQRVHVARFEGEGLVGARLGVLELLRDQQCGAGLDLHGRVVRQQIGRADVLRERLGHLAFVGVGLRKLQPSLPESGILLDGVAVLDDGFRVLPLRHVRVAAAHELPLGDLRILSSTRTRPAPAQGPRESETCCLRMKGTCTFNSEDTRPDEAGAPGQRRGPAGPPRRRLVRTPRSD